MTVPPTPSEEIQLLLSTLHADAGSYAGAMVITIDREGYLQLGSAGVANDIILAAGALEVAKHTLLSEDGV